MKRNLTRHGPGHLTNAPVTVNGVWCAKCGRYVAMWYQDEGVLNPESPLAIFPCICGHVTEMAIAWDDLDGDDRPNMVVVP